MASRELEKIKFRLTAEVIPPYKMGEMGEEREEFTDTRLVTEDFLSRQDASRILDIIEASLKGRISDTKQ